MLMTRTNTSSGSDSAQDAAKMALLGASSPSGFASPSAASSFSPLALESPTPPTATTPVGSAPHQLSRELLQHYAYLRFGSTDGAGGRKQHVCPVKTCGRRFSTPGNLSRHKRLHGPVKPLKCPVDGCICAFRSENKLEKHMKFHLGIPVHVCAVPACGKTFSTAGNLNRHIKGHHPHADVRAVRRALSSTSSSCDDDYESSVGGDEAMYERWDDDVVVGEVLDPAEAAVSPVDQLDALVAILDQDMGGDAATDASTPTESLVSLLLVSEPTELPTRKHSLLDDMIRFHITHIADAGEQEADPTTRV